MAVKVRFFRKHLALSGMKVPEKINKYGCVSQPPSLKVMTPTLTCFSAHLPNA